MFKNMMKFGAVLALLAMLSMVFVSWAMADDYPSEPTTWTIGTGHDKYVCPADWQTLAIANHETSTPEKPLFSGEYPADGLSIFGGWDNDPKKDDDLGGHGFLLRLIEYIVDPQDPNDDEHPYWSNIFSVKAGEMYAGFTGDDSGQIVVCFQEVEEPELYKARVVKYGDVNVNGQEDEGEQRLAGWVYDWTATDGQSGQSTTDTNGVAFATLTDGTIAEFEAGVTVTFTEQVQTGWFVTTANPAGVTVVAGSIAEVKFGNAVTPPELYKARVVKYGDVNVNGQEDEGEQRLAGWVYDWTATDGQSGQSTTDTNGVAFATLTDGTIAEFEAGVTVTFTEQVQTGWFVTTANPAGVTVVAGSIAEVKFGNAQDEEPPEYTHVSQILCSAPGEETNDVTVIGAIFKDGVALKGQEVVAELEGVFFTDTTDENGMYEIVVKNAKLYMNATIYVRAGNDVPVKEFKVTEELFTPCTPEKEICPGDVTINFDMTKIGPTEGIIWLRTAGNPIVGELPHWEVTPEKVGWKVWETKHFELRGVTSVWVEFFFYPNGDMSNPIRLEVVNSAPEQEGRWGTISCYENHHIDLGMPGAIEMAAAQADQFIHEMVISVAEALGYQVGEFAERVYYDAVSGASNVIAVGEELPIHIRPIDGAEIYSFVVNGNIAQHEGGNTLMFSSDTKGIYQITGNILVNGEWISAGKNGIKVYVGVTPDQE